ncbi:MAG: hypothetical protein ACPGUE_14970 [Marinomonas sp.]|jgi:hypothetical protein
MNSVKQGIIFSIFAAIFLLQSISQILPMHESSTSHSISPLAVQFMEISELNDVHLDYVSPIPEHNNVMSMSASSHSDMTENCEIHCQIMGQDCAEIMCATLAYDALIKPSLLVPSMQSVNFYSLSEHFSFRANSLYRPPITTLS